MTRKMPEIIEVNAQQLEELLARAASNTLREEDTQLIRQIFDSYVHLFELVGDKNTTIARLRKLFFGAGTEKAEKLFGKEQKPEASPGPATTTQSLNKRAARRTLTTLAAAKRLEGMGDTACGIIREPVTWTFRMAS